MHVKVFLCLLCYCLAFPLSGCTARQTSESTATVRPTIENTVTVASPVQLPITDTNTVTITGWFTTVWNGGAHYSITDAQGQTTTLLMEDAIAKPLGGPLALDRKRVTIVGEIVSDLPRTVRVLSVQFADTE